MPANCQKPTARLTADVKADLYRRAHTYASANGLKINEFMTLAVESFLRRNADRMPVMPPRKPSQQTASV